MAQEHSRKRRYLSLFVRVAVVFAGLAWGIIWVSQQGRYERLSASFGQMSFAAFAASLVAYAISQVLVAVRWWMLLRTQHVHLRILPLVRLHYLGLFYSNFLPSSIGGDLVRAWYVTKHTEQRFAAVISVFVDRAIGLIATVIMAAVAYGLFLPGRPDIVQAREGGDLSSALRHYGWLIVLAVVFLVAAAGIITLHPAGRAKLSRACIFLKGLGVRALTKARQATILYCRNPLTIAGTFLLTFFLQSMVVVAFWYLGDGMGAATGLHYYFVFFPLTWVIGVLPVSIGGAVVVEGGLVYLFTLVAGVPPEPALAIALCQRVVWMVASLPGALIHLMGAHLPAGLADIEQAAG